MGKNDRDETFVSYSNGKEDVEQDGKSYIIMEKITTEKTKEVENFCTGRESAEIRSSDGANQSVTSGQDC